MRSEVRDAALNHTLDTAYYIIPVVTYASILQAAQGAISSKDNSLNFFHFVGLSIVIPFALAGSKQA